MKTKSLRFVLGGLLLAAIVGGTSYGFTLARPANVALTASGTMETTTISVSPELPGKVKDVLVEEGQTVQAGQVLFRLDDTLLKAQRDAAAAGLSAAQTAAQTAQAAYSS